MKVTFEDLNVVYEDNHIIVVVKPQGVPSQDDETGDASMVTLVKEYLAVTHNKPGNVYLGLVHRLDRPTGGVMVFAKTEKAANRLSEAIRNAEVEKKYVAVVNGIMEEKMGRMTDYLYKYASKNMVQVVPAATTGAKLAVLDYKALAANSEDNSLVGIQLLTGRSHQIRVQMAHRGHSLLGDSKYGTLKGANPYPLALWAYELRFVHPVSKENMVFRVLPDGKSAPWNTFDIDGLLRITICD